MNKKSKVKGVLEVLLLIGLNGFIVLLALSLVLTACSSNQASQPPTATQIAPVTITLEAPTSPLATASSCPTMVFPVTPNPTQLERWREYENTLAKEFLPTGSSREQVLCEWEILGQSEQEVYVWAFCQAAGSIPSAMSAPAVIYLGPEGTVQGVEVPGSGSLYASDVRRLFPTNIQEKIFTHLVDVNRMREHIYWRLEHPEPPLIILSATP